MTMDATAIREIQQSNAAQQLNKELNYERVLIAPENFKAINMEQFQPGRHNFRGSFKTASLTAFGEYCVKHDTAEVATCYVDSDAMTATVIFDQGDEDAPGHCQHTGTIELDKTPDYRALLDINGDRLSQKYLAEWFEDWRDQITAHGEATADDDYPIMAIGKAIASIRRVKIKASAESDHSQSDFSASSSRMASVSAESAEGNVAGFTFTCTPYNELDETTFDVRLSIITDGDKPVFKPRIRMLEKRQIEIAKNFESKLAEELSPTNIEPVIGTFNAGR